MTELVVHRVARAGSTEAAAPTDEVVLDHADRFLRRRLLTSASGRRLRIDLAETVSLAAGDALLAEDGTVIAVVAAPEPLLEVTGPDLVRLAWHIGNRHAPAQIEPGRLLVARDHVLADMLGRLGATVREVCEPFAPEGGAYGLGRTHAHHHGPADADPDAGARRPRDPRAGPAAPAIRGGE